MPKQNPSDEDTTPEEEERNSGYEMDARDIDDLCTMMALGVDPTGERWPEGFDPFGRRR